LSKQFIDYDVATGLFTWEICYKLDGKSILEAILTSENLVDNDDTIYTASTSPSGDTVTIQFWDDDGYVNGSYIIRYKTSYTGTPISDLSDITVSNEVGTGDNSGAEQVHSVSALTKGVSSIDYKDRIIKWNPTINFVRSNLSGLVYTDVFVTDGLDLLPGSVVVKDFADNYRILVENTDYTIEYGSYTVDSSALTTEI